MLRVPVDEIFAFSDLELIQRDIARQPTPGAGLVGQTAIIF